MIFGKRTCRQAILLLAGLSVATIAFSASEPAKFLHSIFDVKQYKPLVTLTVGPDFVQAGQAQTLTLLPPFQNHYTNNSSTSKVVDGGVFVGVERVLTDYFSVQLGVAGYADSQLSPQDRVGGVSQPRPLTPPGQAISHPAVSVNF